MNKDLYEMIFKRKSFHLFRNIGNKHLTEKELKDIEEVSHICAKIISYAINMAIHNLTIEEVKDYLNKI